MSKQQTTEQFNQGAPRTIFLNNMNSWFSNFLIEELRTEISEKNNPKKVANKFCGTLNNSGAKLPRLFEPEIISINYVHHYEHDIFKKQVFIYNLEDADMNEIEYLIRGLKVHAKDNDEKILIIISNPLTWARTPLKETKTGDDDELEPELQNSSFVFEEEKNNESYFKEEEKNNESAPEMNQSKRNSIMHPKKRHYYFAEKDAAMRIPANRYNNYKFIENLALSASNSNKSLITYIVCPGFIYGCGESFFYEFFKLAWYQNPPELPLIEECYNSIPTIHVIDVARTIKAIIERRPTERYIFAVDRTKDQTLRNLVCSISKAVGSGKVSKIKFNSPDIERFPKINDLMVNIKFKTSSLMESKQSEFSIKKGFDWHCEFGIADNLEKIKAEFKEYRNLKNMKIFVTGPPGSGKTTLGSILAKEYNLPHLKIADMIEQAKKQNNQLSLELNQKHEELLNKMVEEAELAQSKKNKKGLPPIDRTQFQVRLPDDIIIKILKSKLKENICTNLGYVLDGFPRNIIEAKSLFFKDDPSYVKQLPSEVPQQQQQKDAKKGAQNQQAAPIFDKEKYNEEYGHLIIDKDISPFYIISIEGMSDDYIKQRLKENHLNNEATQALPFNEDRINRRLHTYKQFTVQPQNLLSQYSIECIAINGKAFDPDFMSKKVTDEIDKFVSSNV